jgi:hypothetical protein
MSVARAITSVILLFSMPSARAAIYENPEYGIETDLPNDLPNCNGVFDEHDHGFVFFLNPRDSNACGDIIKEIRHRTVSLFAYGNAIDDTGTLKLYQRSVCQDEVKYYHSKCVSAPRGLRMGTAANATARINHPDGWVDIVVLTQGGHWPGQAADDPTPAVNYSMTLRTDRAHLKGDLRRFESVLRAIRFVPPGM